MWSERELKTFSFNIRSVLIEFLSDSTSTVCICLVNLMAVLWMDWYGTSICQNTYIQLMWSRVEITGFVLAEEIDYVLRQIFVDALKVSLTEYLHCASISCDLCILFQNQHSIFICLHICTWYFMVSAVFIVSTGTKSLTVKSAYLTEWKTMLLNAEEDFVDSVNSSDDENDLHNMMEPMLVQTYICGQRW